MFTRSHRRWPTVALAGLLLASAGSCTPMATFPPLEGGATFEPWVAPIPQVMRTSIDYVHRRLAPDRALLFNLPPGVPEWIWTQIEGELGGGARPMLEGEPGAITIEQVRINGSNAEADVVYPSGDLYQLITLGLRLDTFQPPRVVFERRWHLPVEQPLSNYGNWRVPNYSDYAEGTGTVDPAEVGAPANPGAGTVTAPPATGNPADGLPASVTIVEE